MRDVRIAERAGAQHNRISLRQLEEIGLTWPAIRNRLEAGRLVRVAEGVFAVAPVLDDPWGRWMGAVLTAPSTFLSRVSASVAWGVLGLEEVVTVVRRGSGGPRCHQGIVVHRSSTLDGNTTEFNGVPITTMERTLLDVATCVSDRALRRAVREAVRLERTSLVAVGDAIGRSGRPRGSRRLAQALASYSGLPIERARSGAEIRAMQVLRESGRPLPRLNFRVAGWEADLVWPLHRLIIEVDGDPFHMDVGEDARKQGAWEGAGWTVRRVPADDVYQRPARLLALAPLTERP